MRDAGKLIWNFVMANAVGHFLNQTTHITSYTLTEAVEPMDTYVPRNASSPAARPRARIACSYCHRRKVRCNVAICGRPCTNCRLDGFECVTRPKKPRGVRISADTQAVDTDRLSVINENQDHCTRIPALADSQMSSRPTSPADDIGRSHGPTSIATEAPFVEISRNTSSHEFSNISKSLQSALSRCSTSKAHVREPGLTADFVGKMNQKLPAAHFCSSTTILVYKSQTCETCSQPMWLFWSPKNVFTFPWNHS